MKTDTTDPAFEQLLSANEKSRHLERQLHDKERELKRKINELNEAHKSNRELQVRIDELREEISFHRPTSPTTGNPTSASLFAELDQLNNDALKKDSSKELVQEAMDLQKNLLIDDMSPDLTLRCYKSLLSGLSNCHQQVVELKQEMWQVYQNIHFTNAILRNYVRCARIEIDVDEEEEEKEVQTPHPINLSLVMSDLSNLVRKITTSKESKADQSDDATRNLNMKLDALVRERDEAVFAKSFMEVSLSNARRDLQSANAQLVLTIQQKLSLQKELEAWQEDMELMIERSLSDKEGMRRVNSLRQPRRSKQSQQASNRRSMFSFGLFENDPLPGDPAHSSQAYKSISSGNTAPDPSEKSVGFFASWLRRKWN